MKDSANAMASSRPAFKFAGLAMTSCSYARALHIPLAAASGATIVGDVRDDGDVRDGGGAAVVVAAIIIIAVAIAMALGARRPGDTARR